MKKVTVIVERASDGGFGCYTKDDLPGFGLAGYGGTVEEAKNDFLQAYEDIAEIFAESGKKCPDLAFEFRYDLKSFFKFFTYLNASGVARRAGITPAIMRRYTAGLAFATERQFEKLQKALLTMESEMHAVAC